MIVKALQQGIQHTRRINNFVLKEGKENKLDKIRQFIQHDIWFSVIL